MAHSLSPLSEPAPPVTLPTSQLSVTASRPDRFAQLTAHLLRAPLVFLILPESYGRWCCPSLALAPEAVNRALVACVAISDDPSPLEVADLACDPRFATGPLSQAPVNMRFLSLWPIRNGSVRRAGALCVLDRHPRHFGAEEHAILNGLAVFAASEFLAQRHWAHEELCRHFAAEIHDGVGQVVLSLYHHLQALAQDQRFCGPRRRSTLRRLIEMARRAVGETRRLIEGLRPTALESLGLAGALRLLADTLEQEGWTIALDERLGAERLPLPMELALFRVAHEALTNTAKHTGQRRAAVTLTRVGDEVRLEVRDWGPGFDPAHLAPPVSLGERLGLRVMGERLAVLGGDLRVQSHPGAGTLVVARVPAPHGA
ncbi:MAG: ATP-binding protein [Chloroflexaceae bacterium]